MECDEWCARDLDDGLAEITEGSSNPALTQDCKLSEDRSGENGLPW